MAAVILEADEREFTRPLKRATGSGDKPIVEFGWKISCICPGVLQSSSVGTIPTQSSQLISFHWKDGEGKKNDLAISSAKRLALGEVEGPSTKRRRHFVGDLVSTSTSVKPGIATESPNLCWKALTCCIVYFHQS
ncbi:hypothetical protein OS493_009059 [Desmophyllum pertusum]|uniref:Uncharacterized protein n=1 Tax=Desmophyllum pertusum TaxID=174260 RepID=A0A9X0CYG5_9CNID|nr:hypothetical protein OS493_009059 [Desmophyllum pertusum]